MEHKIKLSVIIPCLNEEKAIGVCVEKAKKAISKLGITGEVIVVDNCSSDRSSEVAQKAGARVVLENRLGYGSACLRGFKEARGEIIVFGDGDDTYDFLDTAQLIKPLDEGFDLVIGSRLKGTVANGAMPWTHRYIGTPALSLLLRLCFGGKVVDSQSGFRAIRKDAYDTLNLRTTGMEFASEMVIKSLIRGLKIVEVPICYYPRIGESKLHSARDAWRHIRFMLLFSPDYLFIFPALFLLIGGFVLMLALLGGPVYILGRFFDIHFLVAGALTTLVGYQILTLGVYAKTFSTSAGFSHEGFITRASKKFSLEKGIAVGALIFTVGLVLGLGIVYTWLRSGFGPLNEVRLGILVSVLMLIGIQTVFASFFLSILGLEKNGN